MFLINNCLRLQLSFFSYKSATKKKKEEAGLFCTKEYLSFLSRGGGARSGVLLTVD